jgi:putative molybdopterin biosynthesis protein
MAAVRANGYVHIPAHFEGLEAGQEVEVFLTTDPATIDQALLLVGTVDPALGELADHAHARGLLLHASNNGTTGALFALARGSCHAVPLGLPPADRISSDSPIARHLPAGGLAFLHLASVRHGDYGLVIRKDLLDDPKIRSLIDLVNSPELKKRIGRLDGYGTSRTGEMWELQGSAAA